MSRHHASLAVLGHTLATLGAEDGARAVRVRVAESERHVPPPSLTGKVRWLSASGRVSVAAVGALHRSCGGDGERTGIVLATLHGPADVRRRYVEQIRESGYASPTLFTSCGHNVAGGLVATALGLRGTNLCFVGERAGLHALESALLLILDGQVDVAYVGRIDPISADPVEDRDRRSWFGAVLAVAAGSRGNGGSRLSIHDGGVDIEGGADAELAFILDLLLDRTSLLELLP